MWPFQNQLIQHQSDMIQSILVIKFIQQPLIDSIIQYK